MTEQIIVFTNGTQFAAGGGTTATVAYGGVSTYQVLSSDVQVVFDTSAWTTQGALIAILPALPQSGQRVEFFEDGWAIGRPPPQISGNGNPISPYPQGSPTSKERAPGNVTSLIDTGASFAVVWNATVGAWLTG